MRIHRVGRTLWIEAPCKLNLFLEVIGKRPDGYHDLETIMIAVDLCDLLAFEATPRNLSLTVRTAASHDRRLACSIPADSNNIVCRALERLKQELKIEAGMSIELFKRIPAEAGLGGGSSDAAAALIAGCFLWKGFVDHQLVHEIASSLGSDINFFLESHRQSSWLARCTGRGERVEPLILRGPLHFAIVQPPEGCSTVAVFRQFRLKGEKSDSRALASVLMKGNLSQLGSSLHNGLEEAASRESYWIERTRERFRTESVLGDQLSGSGSARFALCANRRSALAVSKRTGATMSFSAAASSWHTPSIEAQLRALR